MSGIYGTVKPASVNITNDVDIYYNYKEDRANFTSDSFQKLDSSVLSNTYSTDSTTEPIPGLYNLKLPLSTFGEKGIYTIYIKPKEMEITIDDIGILMNYPDVRGVVFKKSALTGYTTSNALAGYRLEFLNTDNTRNSLLIVSSNLCMPNNTSNTSGNIRYSFSDSGAFIFCTVTPSIAASYNSDCIPYIGSKDVTAKLVNTKFDPVMYEIEMVDHDADTISNMLEGDQLRNLDSGLITTYNENGEIYNQFEYTTLKDSLGTPLYDVKKKLDVVDASEDINNLDLD